MQLRLAVFAVAVVCIIAFVSQLNPAVTVDLTLAPSLIAETPFPAASPSLPRSRNSATSPPTSDFSALLRAAAEIGKACYLPRFGGGSADDAKGVDDRWTTKKNSATGSVVAVSDVDATSGCVRVQLRAAAAKSGSSGTLPARWTLDAETERFASQLGIDGSRGWSEGKLLLYGGNGAVVGYKAFFIFGGASRVCHPLLRAASKSAVAGAEVRVFELFRGADAVIETGEDLPVRYFTATSDEQTVVAVPLPAAEQQGGDGAAQASLAFADWEVVGPDAVDYEKDPRFGGYWLRFKGDTTRGNKLSTTHDLLGRIDLRAKFAFRGGGGGDGAGKQGMCPAQVAPSLPPTERAARQLLLERLRGRTVLFIGDSHVRTLYYGLLERLGVAFAANRVWRGGHEAALSDGGANCQLRFVPSSFLDIDVLRKAVQAARDQHEARMSKQGAAADGGVVVLAGVAQHHSTHCYTIRRHAAHVERAVATLLLGSGNVSRRIWYGVPAQPVNRHLFAPKPVGQARRDCRSNARHLLYSAVQQAIVRRQGNISFLDAFALSAGLSHTSIDGAHFYSFVRAAMLDAFAESLR